MNLCAPSIIWNVISYDITCRLTGSHRFHRHSYFYLAINGGYSFISVSCHPERSEGSRLPGDERRGLVFFPPPGICLKPVFALDAGSFIYFLAQKKIGNLPA